MMAQRAARNKTAGGATLKPARSVASLLPRHKPCGRLETTLHLVEQRAPNERERLILERMPQVRLIARRIYDRVPASVGLDDLISAGTLGLIAAIDHFDPAMNVKLKTYAEHKIRGAILDSLRELDWAPRQKRKKAKRIESATAAAGQRHQRAPTEDEVASELHLSLDELHGWLVEVRGVNLSSLEAASENGAQDRLKLVGDDEEQWPSCILERAELGRLVDDAIEKMPGIERMVIRLYYKKEQTLREIAQLAGLHESRISQLKTQAILRLRTYMSRRWPLHGAT
ncbi:MAG: FliA/WhiG family RNA polymerase sigma factor [Bryobacteraceae bacterium]